MAYADVIGDCNNVGMVGTEEVLENWTALQVAIVESMTINAPGTAYVAGLTAITPTQWANMVKYARAIYAPFYSVGQMVTADQLLTFSTYSCFKGPMYIPSPLHEMAMFTPENTMLVVEKEHGPVAYQYFVAPFYQLMEAPSLLAFQTTVELSIKLLQFRKFLKLNTVPEAYPMHGSLPHFFAMYKVPNRPVLTVSPYREDYILRHNLNLLATSLAWPKFIEATELLMGAYTVVDVPTAGYQRAAYHVLASTMLDYSFSSDGFEMDAYYQKLRRSQLGLWSFLLGLLPGAISIGKTIFNAIFHKHPSHTDQHTQIMASSGTSTIQTTTPGPIGGGSTVTFGTALRAAGGGIANTLMDHARGYLAGAHPKMFSVGQAIGSAFGH